MEVNNIIKNNSDNSKVSNLLRNNIINKNKIKTSRAIFNRDPDNISAVICKLIMPEYTTFKTLFFELLNNPIAIKQEILIKTAKELGYSKTESRRTLDAKGEE